MTACLLAVLTGGLWQWQQQVRRTLPPVLATEPWQQVREQYPAPHEFAYAGELPEAFLKGFIRANPFSPQRRKVPETPGAGGDAVPAASAPPPPQFIFKGRVLMGTKQRAVLEDAAAKKTYFLQVGQEVAGFKVLDIAETQVVLSTPNSEEPLLLRLTPKEGKKESRSKEE